MPRFYFHLSAPGQKFLDIVGSDASDLVAAHSRAVLLADRVTTYPFTDGVPDFRRWTVKVVDETQQPVINVIFPTNSLPADGNPAPARDARALLRSLDAALGAASPPS